MVSSQLNNEVDLTNGRLAVSLPMDERNLPTDSDHVAYLHVEPAEQAAGRLNQLLGMRNVLLESEVVDEPLRPGQIPLIGHIVNREVVMNAGTQFGRFKRSCNFNPVRDNVTFTFLGLDGHCLFAGRDIFGLADGGIDDRFVPGAFRDFSVVEDRIVNVAVLDFDQWRIDVPDVGQIVSIRAV